MVKNTILRESLLYGQYVQLREMHGMSLGGACARAYEFRLINAFGSSDTQWEVHLPLDNLNRSSLRSH